MILTEMIDINKMLKLTKGQGHKIKGQGQICKLAKEIVLTVIHEPMIVYG